MTAGLKLLTVLTLLVISACVSAGTKAITDAGVVSQIEVGKSTRAVRGHHVVGGRAQEPGQATAHGFLIVAD